MKSSNSIHLIEQELQAFPPGLVDEFRKAAPIVEGKLAEDDFYAWVREGVTIAQSGFRHWKTAAEYFRVTPQALENLSFPQLINWARWGRMLSEESVNLSLDYFRESPAAFNSLPIHQIEEWAKLGKSLYKGSRQSTSFAWRFFQISPGLFRYLTLDETIHFINFADYLTKNWHEFASDCLNSAEEVLPQLEKQDRKMFLDLALVFAETIQDDVDDDVRDYFNLGPKILSGIARSERTRFLLMAAKIRHRVCDQALPFLIDGSQALSLLPDPTHHHLLTLAEELLNLSCLATIEFLKSCPTVLGRSSLPSLELWFREGVRTLQKSEESGIAYFRTELNRSIKLIEHLSRGIELSSVREILGTYYTALTGKSIAILPTNNTEEIGIGWASLSTTEEAAVFLPELVEKYHTKGENFTWYKVVVTHQAGHLEFGSFDFCFEKKANLFSNLRPQLAQQPVNRYGTVADLQRFFDLFDNRNLATDIFTILEDSRVDYLVNHEYKGIGKDYKKIQNDALSIRPPLTSQPLKEVFLEILIQLSLGSAGEFLVPSELRTHLQEASSILRRIQSSHATVEDCAEATIRLYQLVCQITNKFVPPDDCEIINLSEELDDFSPSPADEAIQNSASPLDEEANTLPYTSPQEVEFRGDFKPELVQLLIKLKEQHQEDAQGASSPLSQEILKELAAKNAEIEIKELSIGKITSPERLFVSDLKDAGKQNISPGIGQPKNESRGKGGGETLENDNFQSFFYDEWDFRANDYLRKWCRVREKTMNEGTPDFFETTLTNHTWLIAQIKRQFELLNTQTFRKVKRLQDGEEFDLDAVVEFIVDKKTRQSPNEKIYWRRNKTERDVSVVFLLDMSSSTIEYIDERQRESDNRYFARDYKEYLEWFQLHHDNQGRPRAFQRIIDLEKEGTVLLIKALETIGDTYAIYGFSGYGRENVEFYVIKDLEEEFSDKVKERIDSISPMHGTRMGPAIRHATWKLEQHQSKSKFLFLISDGRPQDHGYGRVGSEKEYAINDTKMALLEAKWKNITPFCLTVDRAGHDYLKTMCYDMGYEVVADIESLPKRLPALYRKLTI